MDIDKGLKRSGKKSEEKDTKIKYKVEVLPTEDDDLKTLCRRLIGGGETFCLRKGCTISHRGSKSLADVKAGDVVILKSAKVGYCDPVTTQAKIHPETISEWKHLTASFEEWNSKFVALNSSVGDDVSPEQLRAFEEKARRAKQVQTPGKGLKIASPLRPVDVSPYEKIIFNPWDADLEAMKTIDDEEVTRTLVSLENGLEEKTEHLIRLVIDSHARGLDAVQNFEVLFDRVNDVKT
jgi:hypothetical protein